MNLQENINRIQEMMGIINEDSSAKEIIFDIITDAVENTDLYEHKGSIWLILTDNKKWVLQITEDGTLWYNYYFFQSLFDYLSLDVVENQHYITEWVEDTIKNGVRSTSNGSGEGKSAVEDTIKNGVRSTKWGQELLKKQVEDTIKNGIKQTKQARNAGLDFLEIMSKIDNK